MSSPSDHYTGAKGAAYFTRQNQVGDLGGKLSARHFIPYVKAGDRVLDFGCGGGWVLKNIPDIERHGVEINTAAVAQAKLNGVSVTSSIDEQHGIFDIVISNHCLEHVISPIESLQKLHGKLRDSGRIVIVVPLDDWRTQRNYDVDQNHHLHTWTPLLIANTLREAGFTPDTIQVVTRAWPPKKELFARYLPDWAFDAVCGVCARLLKRRELCAVATKT